MTNFIHLAKKSAMGLFLLSSFSLSAAVSDAPDPSVATNSAIIESPAPQRYEVVRRTKLKAPKPQSVSDSLSSSVRGPRHLMMTAELGSSIDLGSHDMSTFDFDLAAFYTNQFIRAAGIGIGVHRSFGSSNTFIPLYLLFQSSFRPQPSLIFFSLKVGYSFSAVGNSAMYGDTSAMAGLGFNLAMKRNFRSHIIVGFGFRHYNRKHQSAISLDTQNVGLAHLAFGVSF